MAFMRMCGLQKRTWLPILGLILVSALYAVPAISINNQAAWDLTQTSFTLPTTPGDNILPSSLQSPANQANIDVKSKRNDPVWTVKVKRNTASWSSLVKVEVRVTSTHANVWVESSYIEVTETEKVLFYSTVDEVDALNVQIQVQVSGLTSGMGAENSTTITYSLYY